MKPLFGTLEPILVFIVFTHQKLKLQIQSFEPLILFDPNNKIAKYYRVANGIKVIYDRFELDNWILERI